MNPQRREHVGLGTAAIQIESPAFAAIGWVEAEYTAGNRRGEDRSFGACERRDDRATERDAVQFAALERDCIHVAIAGTEQHAVDAVDAVAGDDRLPEHGIADGEGPLDCARCHVEAGERPGRRLGRLRALCQSPFPRPAKTRLPATAGVAHAGRGSGLRHTDWPVAASRRTTFSVRNFRLYPLPM